MPDASRTQYTWWLSVGASIMTPTAPRGRIDADAPGAAFVSTCVTICVPTGTMRLGLGNTCLDTSASSTRAMFNEWRTRFVHVVVIQHHPLALYTEVVT